MLFKNLFCVEYQGLSNALPRVKSDSPTSRFFSKIYRYASTLSFLNAGVSITLLASWFSRSCPLTSCESTPTTAATLTEDSSLLSLMGTTLLCFSI